MKTQKSIDPNFDSSKFFSFASDFVKRMLGGVSVKACKLQDYLLSPVATQPMKQAGRFAGRKPGWHVETTLLKKVRRAGFGRLVKQFKKLKPSDFESQLKVAEDNMTNEVKFKGNKRRLIEAANRVRIACKFGEKKFKPYDLRYVVENHLNRSASSGYPLYQRKGKVLNEIYSGAKEVLDGRKPFPYTDPTSRGFRLQQRKSGDDIKLKVRIMYPYPAVITAIEAFFGSIFVDHFINTDTFYVIGKNGAKICDLIKTKLGKTPGRKTSTDIVGFDQAMTNEALIAAFAILRQQLILTRLESFIFGQMVQYFCTSIMVSKSHGQPVLSFVKLHGLPSGSFFTNLVGSLAHAICIEYACPGLIEESMICGDDNIFNSANVNLPNFYRTLENDLNLKVGLEKTESFPSWENVSFLGFNWVKGVRYVDPKLVVNQLLWHTDFRVDMSLYEREIARGASVLLNGINGKEIFAKIFPEVMEQIDRGIDVRFIYLHTYRPAPKLASLENKYNVVDPNQSLREHLQNGWKIR